MQVSEKFRFNQPRVGSENLNLLIAPPPYVYTMQLEKECEKLYVLMF